MEKYDQALALSFNDIGDWSILFGALVVVYKRLMFALALKHNTRQPLLPSATSYYLHLTLVSCQKSLPASSSHSSQFSPLCLP
jgi:hypothetical protein